MMPRSGLLAIVVVAIVIIVAVLLFPRILNQSSPKAALSNVNNLPSMFTAAQSLYNSSGPFNISYTFYMGAPFFSATSINSAFSPNSSVNGTFRIAKYGSSFRTYSTFSSLYPYKLLNASVLMHDEAVSIYNSSHLILCEKEMFINESPVDTSIETVISSVNSKPIGCNSTALAVPSFYVASSFTMVPFETFHLTPENFTSLKSSNGSVHFLGYRTYLGQSCSVEELLPPPNETGSAGVSINYCISSANGLPLHVKLQVNGSVVMEDTISAINTAPSNTNVVTALPPGAVLG